MQFLLKPFQGDRILRLLFKDELGKCYSGYYAINNVEQIPTTVPATGQRTGLAGLSQWNGPPTECAQSVAGVLSGDAQGGDHALPVP